MPRVSPEILRWARETAGLDLSEAARRVGLRAARGVEPADRLAALEEGEGEPTRPLLRRMAKQYRRPLVAFYLAAPPPSGERGDDFRTTTATVPPEEEPWLDALIRGVRARQHLICAALEDEDGVDPLAFVGAYSIDQGPDVLSEAIRSTLGFDLASFRSHGSLGDAFRYLRGLTEDAGVFALLMGDLGSHHTALSPDTFRGYALAHPVAPFIVINDRDARAAWSFTLLHELCHIFTGHSGVSGGYAQIAVERVCNDAASGILLPSDDLEELGAGVALDPDAISSFAHARNISRTMVAYRLFREGRIGRSTWEDLRSHFEAEWIDHRHEVRARTAEREGGPSYYVVRRHRLGPSLLGTVAYMLKRGSLTTVKAGQILGVKPKNLAELLAGPPSALGV